MKSNHGFGRFEVLTVIVVLLGIFAYLGYKVVNGSYHKYETMKDSAINFSKAVTVNFSSFHNSETVYLDEVVDEQLLKKIKSPVSSGYCSGSESVVELIDGMPYVTLRCGNVLIDKVNFSETDQKIDYYKVSNWSEQKKNDTDEEITLYNCIDNGKEVFDEYYQELYFVYRINKEYETSYYFASSVKSVCQVVSKTFYRTKEVLK